MASRYSQEYFFQHTLMNVSFTNLNEIIHPNAENIPEYIRHYASAIFVNGSFWDDQTKVIQELQMEGHRQDYIDSYMSYIKMLKSTYHLVTKGKTFFWLKHINSLSPYLSSFTLAIFTLYIQDFQHFRNNNLFKHSKKEKSSFFLRSSSFFLWITFTLSLILFIDFFLLNIF